MNGYKFTIVLFAFGLGFLLLEQQTAVTVAAPAEAAIATSWEHMAMTVEGEKLSTPEIARRIIKIGEDGWELVDVETFAKDGTTFKTVYFFKRPKS